MKYFLSLLSFLLIVSCATTKTNSKYAKIEYEAGACFGFCPIYKITIDSDQTAVFEAKRFNFSKDTSSEKDEGNFTGKIDPEKYEELVLILDSINPKGLKESYGNKNVTDLPTSYLSIKYNDGTTKKMEDYGKRGTPELKKLYQFFDELKTNQNWTKIE